MKTLRPALFLISLLLIVGLACSFGRGSGGDPTSPPQPTAVQVIEPTTVPTEAPPEPTAVPPTEEPPIPQAEEFFTEEFDQDPGSDWETGIIGPGAEAYGDSVTTEFANSSMRIELPEDGLYFYYTYTAFDYTDVRLDLRADNRGVNYNNVSLVCRASSDGWYEWSVRSDGLWDLWAVTDKYNWIMNGGTTFLKQGKEVNEYSMICQDKKIYMFINDQEIKQSPVTDNKYGIRNGTVGFNISSLDRKITPVIVEVDWFKISEP